MKDIETFKAQKEMLTKKLDIIKTLAEKQNRGRYACSMISPHACREMYG